jgi:hypothetical protein
MADRIRHAGSTALTGRRSGPSAASGARWCLLLLALSSTFVWASQALAIPQPITIEAGRDGNTVRWKSNTSTEWGYKVAISNGPKCNPDVGCRKTQYAEVQRTADPQEFTVYLQNLEPGLGASATAPVYVGIGIEQERNTNPVAYAEQEVAVFPLDEGLTGFPAPRSMWTEGDALFWEGPGTPWGYTIAFSNDPRCGEHCRTTKSVQVPAGINPQAYLACTANIPLSPIPNPVYVGIGALAAPGTNPPSYTGNEVAITPQPCPPPTVLGGAASAISQSTAILNATVNPNGTEATDCHFEYGTSTAYGASAPCSSLPGSGLTATAVSAQLVGLAAGTTYHFRIVATGTGGGTSYGNDQTLSTVPSSPPIVLPPVNLLAPSISGKTVAGYSLTSSPGTWEHGPTSYGYQWQRCNAAGGACENIRGAVEPSLALTTADIGHRLRVAVVAGNAGGSASAFSQLSPAVGSKVEAKIEWTFNWFSKYTVVEAFEVTAIPLGGVVEVICNGKGCPFKATKLTPPATRAKCRSRHCPSNNSNASPSRLSLGPLFKRRHLRPGTVITVRVLKEGWVGRTFAFTVMANHRPKHSSSCLAPGSKQPGQGC